MNIDIDDVESRINDGIYGGDHMSDTQRDDAFAALAALLAEVERLRGEAERERAAVVAALRRFEPGPMGFSLVDMASVTTSIERREHRREEEK